MKKKFSVVYLRRMDNTAPFRVSEVVRAPSGRDAKQLIEAQQDVIEVVSVTRLRGGRQ